MTALMLAAEAAKEEGSHTAFYIAGGALAAWAVIVSFAGITRPDFPGTQAVRSGVIALTAVLVIGAMSTAIITAG
jgi:hypothetical protein